ncbi:MAG: FG-GAP repeat domain-containing protein [Rhodothermales bacterium]
MHSNWEVTSESNLNVLYHRGALGSRYGWVLFLFASASFSACHTPGPTPAVDDTPAEVLIAYSDVTQATGLGEFVHEAGAYGKYWFPETVGAGGAFFDYNGDGWLDVLLVAGGKWPGQGVEDVAALRLYENTGEGGFIDVTAKAKLDAVHAFGFGVLAADFDNDNDQDVFFTTLGQNYLLRNEGGVFEDITLEAGVAGHTDWSTTAMFFDADKDGWLDLYVGNYVEWAPELDLWCSLDDNKQSYCAPQEFEGEPAYFYHNNGDGTFSDWT